MTPEQQSDKTYWEELLKEEAKDTFWRAKVNHLLDTIMEHDSRDRICYYARSGGETDDVKDMSKTQLRRYWLSLTNALEQYST